jgi:hypothetical protein
MRAKPWKTRDLILSLSKDEAKISCLFSSLLGMVSPARLYAPKLRLQSGAQFVCPLRTET